MDRIIELEKEIELCRLFLRGCFVDGCNNNPKYYFIENKKKFVYCFYHKRSMEKQEAFKSLPILLNVFFKDVDLIKLKSELKGYKQGFKDGVKSCQ